MDRYLFQYCQKLVVFSADRQSVLLCKRKGEQDYDGAFSFIGGKMETTDSSILDGLRREKNEEVGEACKIRVFPAYTANVLFRKKDGNSMVLPHYACVYVQGGIVLNEEYSEYRWIPLDQLEDFEPKIETIPQAVAQMLRLMQLADEKEFQEI
jgi:ADP-ribose pyrophosphatase YjhB (NUDIX family)